jgi:hypothetical protein
LIGTGFLSVETAPPQDAPRHYLDYVEPALIVRALEAPIGATAMIDIPDQLIAAHHRCLFETLSTLPL